ncbi:MAG TPA: EF-hand domain-containing protein [Candidatus Binatia bacterium]|nr:EF-hand domain-containing protein [Candidatus Binatia bacterium]
MKSALALCLVGLGCAITFAQDAPDRPPREGRPGPGPGPGPGPRFVMPLMAVLDANSDGILDETEIANASAALKKLDKNNDGKIDREELRPPRPDGHARPNGPRPEGGEGQPRPRPPGEQ